MVLLSNLLLLSVIAASFSISWTATIDSKEVTKRSIEENNDCSTIFKLLRGKDGRDGEPGPRGERGPSGPPGAQGPPGPRSGGVTYIRWGRTTCPNTAGTELVYAGKAAGSKWSHTGGGANYLCMPPNPQYSKYQRGVQGKSTLYGVEYEPQGGPLNYVQEHDAPCALCFVSNRETSIMVPGTMYCPQSWSKEYSGYLVSTRQSSPHYRSMYECLDGRPESYPSSHRNHPDQAVFYHVEASCGTLPCPPYSAEKELTCVVCTK